MPHGQVRDVLADRLAALDVLASLLLLQLLLVHHLLTVHLALLGLLLHGSSLEIVDRELEELAVVSEPAVLHDLLQRGAVRRVGDEHLGEQVSWLGGDVLGKGEGRSKNVLVEEVDVVSPSGLAGSSSKGR